ncbi:MAG: right-handed parallel beta-helix repeat-containing protein [Myxococcales bacterium]
MADRQQIHHANRFTLVIYPRISKATDVVRFVAERLGVRTQRSHPVRVRFADGYETAYHFEYRLNSTYMDELGVPTWVRLGSGTYESSLPVSRSGTGQRRTWEALESAFSKRLADLELPAGHAESIRRRRGALLDAMQDRDPSAVTEFFDREYMARFEAFRMLVGASGHGFGIGNDFIYFDVAAGLFYPVQHRDILQRRIADREVLERMTYGAPETRYVLWELLSRDDALRQAKYERIQELVDSPSFATALTEFEHRVASVDASWFRDLPGWVRSLWNPTGPVPPSIPSRAGRASVVRENMARLREALGGARPQVSAAQVDGECWLWVEPHARSALRIVGPWPAHSTATWATHEDAAGEVASQRGSLSRLDLMDGLDGELERIARDYLVRLPGTGCTEQAITFELSLTGKRYEVRPTRLEAPDARMRALAVDAPVNVPDAVERAKALAPGLGLVADEDGMVELPAGEHTLEQDLVLPRGVGLRIGPGTTLRMAPGVSLLVRGALVAEGTAARPVSVTAAHPTNPFGTLAAVGDGRSVCRLAHLWVDRGSEDYLLGAHLSGSVSLYHHDQVRARDVQVRGSASDDGMNVKYARVDIRNSVFEENFADQLDLDVVTGTVDASRFRGQGGGDLNGDGVDVSYSTVTLRDGVFADLGDKGISIGEKTDALLLNNSLKRNDLGVAVKGSSRAIFVRNVFEDNGTDVSAYKKQKSFSGGTSYFIGREGIPDRRFGDDESLAYDLPDVPGDIVLEAEAFANHAASMLGTIEGLARPLPTEPLEAKR